jgi:hypothetical protein
VVRHGEESSSDARGGPEKKATVDLATRGLPAASSSPLLGRQSAIAFAESTISIGVDGAQFELGDLRVIPNRVEATGLWTVTITHLPTGAWATPSAIEPDHTKCCVGPLSQSPLWRDL